MTTAQTLYVLAFSVYLLFFVLFARFFVWKCYSERRYWNRRPSLSSRHLEELSCALGLKVPFISLLIPARNESLVIENTIKHLLTLSYREDSYEIIVITDEKEEIMATAERQRILEAVESVLSGKRPELRPRAPELNRARAVMLSVISDYALAEFFSRKFQKDHTTGVPELSQIPFSPRQRMIAEICCDILDFGGAPPRKRLKSRVRKACPWLSELDLERVYPACLTVAMPVLAAYTGLCDDSSYPMLRKAIRHTAEANHELTQDIIRRMAEFIGKRVTHSLRGKVKTEELRQKLRKAMADMYPTTQEVVERVKRELEARVKCPTLKHVTVPFDFDGKLGGQRTGHEVPSTKGRALNWGLAFIDERAEVCGFYDAESRPHRDVLLYVGYRRLLDPISSRILQGPVFQVRNFYKMTAFCRIAAIYQAIAHDWYLPWLFRTLPFVGGTNVFVARELLEEIAGWDCQVLTEDLELGARAYLKCDAWPEYLPYSSSEQTPPTFRAFFRQRLRWGTGHLQVVDKVSKDTNSDSQKRQKLRKSLIAKGQVEWVLYQMATFVPPLAMAFHYWHLLDPEIIPPAGQWFLSVFSLIYMGFTIYAFRRYSQYLDQSFKPDNLLGRFLVYLGLFILPLAAFMFPVPYTTALVLKAVGKEPRSWVNTPLTEEEKVAG